MSIYALSDLHLAFGIDKPMDIFGGNWENYMEKTEENWCKTVKDNDYVIIPGDISWATYIEQAVRDFAFIDSLPGRKIISKGNHDYWWSTMNKLEKFINVNNFNSIYFLHNNSYMAENVAICGTKGWLCPNGENFTKEDEKIFQRELIRLELSLKSIKKNKVEKIITAIHYPPFNLPQKITGFIEIMVKYDVDICIYGHLHGEKQKNAVTGKHWGMEFKLVSADFLNFTPVFLL
jgi:uncharacterized protein